jgi:hypothetical protein
MRYMSQNSMANFTLILFLILSSYSSSVTIKVLEIYISFNVLDLYHDSLDGRFVLRQTAQNRIRIQYSSVRFVQGHYTARPP